MTGTQCIQMYTVENVYKKSVYIKGEGYVPLGRKLTWNYKEVNEGDVQDLG